MKTSKLYSQLLLNVAIPLALGLMILAFINYSINLKKLKDNEEWQRQLVYKQVKDITEVYDQGLFIYEKHFDERLNNLSESILNNFKGREEELMRINPDVLRKKFHFDTLNEDFYVLDSTYTIVNTSFSKDAGLNLVKRNKEAKFFFDSLRKINTCHVDRFSTELITGNFRKYSYMPSANKKIILELGISSRQATDFKNERKNRVENVKSLFPEILKIHLFQAIYDSKPIELSPELLSFYNATIRDRKSHRATIKNGNTTHYHDFLFMPIQSSGMFHGYVVHIETDDSRHKMLIWKEIMNALLLFVCALLPIFIILVIRAKSITRPIVLLSKKSKIISEGNLNERIEVRGNNEIAELSQNFNTMIDKLQASYENLEHKVKERTAEVLAQKQVIEQKHQSITDSISYAERIQRSFLASEQHLNRYLKNYFIFFKPKDIVSGDFYWSATLSNGNFVLATADSTGHGVPGAIMSLLNISSLEKAVENHTAASDILSEARKIIINRLSNDGSIDGGKDGMDCSLCIYDFDNMKLSVAAANNPVWIIRNRELIEIKADKMPVGKYAKDDIPFNENTFDLRKGDLIYTLTDGFADQFGGEKGKKFMIKSLKELLMNIAHLPMKTQQEKLDTTFKEWKGNEEQLDDVTIIGVQI